MSYNYDPNYIPPPQAYYNQQPQQYNNALYDPNAVAYNQQVAYNTQQQQYNQPPPPVVYNNNNAPPNNYTVNTNNNPQLPGLVSEGNLYAPQQQQQQAQPTQQQQHQFEQNPVVVSKKNDGDEEIFTMQCDAVSSVFGSKHWIKFNAEALYKKHPDLEEHEKVTEIDSYLMKPCLAQVDWKIRVARWAKMSKVVLLLVNIFSLLIAVEQNYWQDKYVYMFVVALGFVLIVNTLFFAEYQGRMFIYYNLLAYNALVDFKNRKWYLQKKVIFNVVMSLLIIGGLAFLYKDQVNTRQISNKKN